MTVAETLAVRSATVDDVAAIAAIDARVHQRPWSNRMRVHQVQRADGVYLIAEASDRVVAHGGVIFAPDAGHVSTIAVDPDWQRQGIAMHLLARLITAAADRGCPAVTLEVRAGNAAAIELYRRFEMSFAGRREGYYADNGEDALIFWTPDLTNEYLTRVPTVAASGDLDRTVAASGDLDRTTAASGDLDRECRERQGATMAVSGDLDRECREQQGATMAAPADLDRECREQQGAEHE